MLVANFEHFWPKFQNLSKLSFFIERPLLVCSIDPKIFLMTTKIEIFWWNFGNFCLNSYPWFDNFCGQKSRFLDFFKVVLKMFRKCLGIIFGFRRPIFSSKAWYMTFKIKIVGQILALWEGHFDQFRGQKTRFLGFMIGCLELFRSYLSIFGLERPFFRFIFRTKVWYMTSKIKIVG